MRRKRLRDRNARCVRALAHTLTHTLCSSTGATLRDTVGASKVHSAIKVSLVAKDVSHPSFLKRGKHPRDVTQSIWFFSPEVEEMHSKHLTFDHCCSIPPRGTEPYRI